MQLVYETIPQAFLSQVKLSPSKQAILNLEAGRAYAYKEVWEEADEVARGFLSLGVGPGDKVCLVAPNLPEWMIIWLGLSKIGAPCVPVDPNTSPEDLAFIITDSEAIAVIGTEESIRPQELGKALEIYGDTNFLRQVIILNGEGFGNLLGYSELKARGKKISDAQLEAISRSISPEDPVALMYTSGTTGRPKGVILDHLGLVNKSLASMERQGMNKEDRFCLFFPLFHMFGNTCIALSGLLIGATLVIPSNAFNPDAVEEALITQGITAIFGSPSMFISILEKANTMRHWQRVKKGTVGGANCPAELMRKLVQDVGIQGLVTAYGITEASSWITMAHPSDPLFKKIETVGKSLPYCEVKVVESATGEDMKVGSRGEILTKGLIMKGYFKRPQATKEAVDLEGWFHTGDLGYMDQEGYLRVTGRIKEVIRRSATEIVPQEIEEAFYGHPKVIEAYAFGTPDPQKGQELVIWVRSKEGEEITPEELYTYAKEKLPQDKLPKFYGVVQEFPKTKSGKIQRFRLQEAFNQVESKCFSE